MEVIEEFGLGLTLGVRGGGFSGGVGGCMGNGVWCVIGRGDLGGYVGG